MADWATWTQRLRPYGAVALLIPALLFVGAVTYLPHMVTSGEDLDRNPYLRLSSAYVDHARGERDDYPYMMHVDELVHWVRMASLQRADTVAYDNPYTGGSREGGGFGLRGSIHEEGFEVAFAQFQEMTGVPWVQLIRFEPAAAAMVTAALMWVALRPWAGAPLAAAFVALIPTSARFLGPGFFVPSGAGLMWVAAALALTKWVARDRHVFALALLLGAWAFFIHLVDGAATVLLYAVALPLALRENRRYMFTTILGTLLPLLWFYNRFSPAFRAEAEKFSTIPIDYSIFDQIGIPILFAWAGGIALMTLRRPPRDARIPIITGAVVSTVIFAAMLANRRFDWNLYALYDRWHQPLALFLSIGAAYVVVEGGRLLAAGWRWGVERWTAARMTQIRPFFASSVLLLLVGVPLVAGTGAAVAAQGLDYHLREPYYQVLNDDDWNTYYAAKDIGPPHEVFLAHPWKAPAYVALSGNLPYSWLDPGSPPKRWGDYLDFYRFGFQDDLWLIERHLSIIAEPGGQAILFVDHPSGAQVLRDPEATILYEIRHPP